jgi:hypothetical protein
VTGLATTPEQAFGAAAVVRMRVSAEGKRRISALVWDAFETDARSGQPVPLGDGPYPGSLFYGSSEAYALTHTCNTWTAEVLQAGGTAVRAAGVVFAGQVVDRARAATEGVGPGPMAQAAAGVASSGMALSAVRGSTE